MDRNYDVMTFILRKAGVANFADTIKIATKTTLKDPKKVKRIRHYVSKLNLYLYFLI